MLYAALRKVQRIIIKPINTRKMAGFMPSILVLSRSLGCRSGLTKTVIINDNKACLYNVQKTNESSVYSVKIRSLEVI